MFGGNLPCGNGRAQLLTSVALPSSICGMCRMGKEYGRLHVANGSFLSTMPLYYKRSKMINIEYFSLGGGFMSI